MPTKIDQPTVIQAHGTPPKEIREFIGRVNTQTHDLSIAQMSSPPGWEEPGQTPEFDEYTLVLEGELVVETAAGEVTVSAGQAIITYRGEWVRYRTPGPTGCNYISVCHPAFSPQSVHRDADS
jgi:mannose-6-phosphate isomerase-like protein (cupin superfamily)